MDNIIQSNIWHIGFGMMFLKKKEVCGDVITIEVL